MQEFKLLGFLFATLLTFSGFIASAVHKWLEHVKCDVYSAAD